MENIKKYILVFIACFAVATSQVFTACDSDDDYNTNQIKSGVSLSAAQLQVTRGGYMVFKGNGLEQITSIVFPENISISNIEVVDKYTIRCIVPEEAVEGKVQLLYNGGTLETAEIAFTEPITITDFSPKEVKPGDIVTITGTYLADVTIAEFNGAYQTVESATRTEVKVMVPIWAKTGSFMLAIPTKLSDGTSDYNAIGTDDDLVVVEPTITKISATTLKAGDELTIEGTQLNQIQFVQFNNAANDTIKADNVYTEVTSLTVNVPVTATDGKVTLISYAGIEYQTDSIKLVMPTANIKDAQASYGVDETVVIEGTDLDLITSAIFTGESEAIDITITEEGTIKLTVTAAAKSGDITLSLANGQTIAVEGFATTKPTIEIPTSVTPLDKLTIASTLGTRIVSLKFGEEVAEVSANSDDEISFQVPLAALSGNVTIVMDNGEEVDAGSITVNAYTFAAITSLASEEIVEGNLYPCEVVNGENIEKITINGEECQYLLVGTKLYISTEVGMGGNAQLVIKSNDGTEVPYTISLARATSISVVVMNTLTDLGNWDDPRVYLAADVFSSIPSGIDVTMTIQFIQKEEWGQVQINDGYWKNENVKIAELGNSAYLTTDNCGGKDATSIDLTLSADLVAHFVANNGIVMQGQNWIISKITLSYELPSETVIVADGSHGDTEAWTFPVSMSWASGGRFAIFKDTPANIISKIVVGAKLRFYASGTGQIQINNANWVEILKVEEWSDAGEHVFEVELTQKFVDAANNGDGWSTAWLICQGDGLTVTKVTIE